MTTKPAGLSLADLDASKASETPFEFEYILPDGKPSGVFLQVLGAQSPTVVAETQRLLNDRRKQDAMASVQAQRSGRNTPTFTRVEDDVEFGQRLSAVRLVGWRNLTDPYTPENALKLIQTNRSVADQVGEASEDLANFMGPSRRAS